MGPVKTLPLAKSLQRWDDENAQHPVAADVLRVASAGIIAWYHIWQQSWVGAGRLDFLPRTGYAWVDIMILLSVFCLFLPHASAAAEGRGFAIDAKTFYKKRAVRILPSYYVCILAGLAVTLAVDGWTPGLGRDLLAHLTFTQMFVPGAYIGTRLPGVTWTLTIFAVLYAGFPLLARALRRRPVAVILALLAVQGVYTVWCLGEAQKNRFSLLFNQFPAFCGVAAVGVAAAYAFAYGVRRPRAWGLRAVYTAAGICAVRALVWLLQHQAWDREIQQHQLIGRMPLTLAAAAALVCIALGLPLGPGRLWRFLSGLTFNLYLWHQQLAVWMKYNLRIPAWQGEVPPNQIGDHVWMHRFNLLCWAVALAAALVLTYLCEKPAAKRLARKLGLA